MVARFSTSRVFLDTEVFVRADFNYESAPFKALLGHITTGRVGLFLTDLTLREIRSNLQEAVANALDRFSTARRRASLIRDCPSAASLLAGADDGAIAREGMEAFDRFLAACKPTILEVKNAFLRPVMDDYFLRRPPFGTGKDKAQFPDALVVAALTDYSRHDQTICAVSGDEAFRSACNPLHHLDPYETLPSFLNAVASEDRRSEFIHNAMGSLDEEIAPKVKEQFENLGFELYRELGDVEDVHVEEVSFRDSEVNILTLNEDSALVMERTSIRFTALVERVRDSDTFEIDSSIVTRTVERDVLVYLRTDYQNLESIELVSAGLPDKRDVKIRLDDE